MIDLEKENSVNIRRNKKRLEELRNEEQANGGRISSRGYAEDRERSLIENAGGTAGIDRGSEEGTGRDEEGSRLSEGVSAGIRQAFTENEYSTASSGQGDGEIEPSLINVVPEQPRETPEERAERAAELHRQRQQRYKDRKKAEQQGEIQATMLEPEHETSASRQPVMRLNGDAPYFSWKLPFKKSDAPPEKVKLFSNKEADEALERMTEIYAKGSGLLDDVLEIVVKDHEPVSIWQLSDEEAEMMASIHLERAKVDEGAARAARKLMELYNRFYMFWLVGPRLKASGSYIKEHKGFSFK